MKKDFKISNADEDDIAYFNSETSLMKCKYQAEFFKYLLKSWREIKEKQEKVCPPIIQSNFENDNQN
jgi:hypothetical protein